MSQISLLIRIKANPEKVFEQISTSTGIEKWFTKASITAERDTEKQKLQLWGATEFDIVEFAAPVRVVWRCTSKDDPWFGTEITFSLRAESGKTIVTFDHTGWAEVTDFYRDCTMSWAYFLESLRLFIETGKGAPEDSVSECDTSVE